MNKVKARVIARKIYETECLVCERFTRGCTQQAGYEDITVYQGKEFKNEELEQGMCILNDLYITGEDGL